MRYRLFGRTGVYVSELCFGAMTFGGKGFWQAIGKLGSSEVETLVGTSLDSNFKSREECPPLLRHGARVLQVLLVKLIDIFGVGSIDEIKWLG